MQAVVRLYSVLSGEIKRFLFRFYSDSNLDVEDNLKEWQKDYPNPIEIVDIIGAYVENVDDFNLSMWVSLDEGVLIKVTEDNGDELIRYLYERFPY